MGKIEKEVETRKFVAWEVVVNPKTFELSELELVDIVMPKEKVKKLQSLIAKLPQHFTLPKYTSI